jgi:predicted alpha/beta superfamily hydrolase
LIAALTLTMLISACGRDEPRPSTAGPSVQVLAPALPMPGLARTRTLRVYLPPSYAGSDRRYPVIYMHDGQNLFDDATSFAGEWGVDESMDALAQTHGFEAIVVGIDNGGDKRMNELSAWPHAAFGAAEGAQYLAFLVDVVKPHIDQHYRTEPGRNSTAIIGSSMGGLASHYAIQARPDVFGMAGVLSPSYWVAPQLYDEARAKPLQAGARVYLYSGGVEGAQDTRRMHGQLAATTPPQNLTLSIVEAADHNEAAWRAEFPRVVAWLFGEQEHRQAPEPID